METRRPSSSSAEAPPFRRQLDAWEEDGLVERSGVDGRVGVPTRRVKGPAISLAKHLAHGLDVRLGAKGVGPRLLR